MNQEILVLPLSSSLVEITDTAAIASNQPQAASSSPLSIDSANVIGMVTSRLDDLATLRASAAGGQADRGIRAWHS